MADVTIDAAGVLANARTIRSTVFVTPLKGYCFFIDAGNDLKYIKTSDGGATWTGLTVILTSTVQALDVWFDQWTPGDLGSNIHIWYIDGGAVDNVIYNRLDTNNDTLAGAVTVFDGASEVAARGIFVSGAKMRGGNLLCCFDIDAGAETGTYRSTDNGTTWGSRTNLIEATIDQAFVFPGNEADNQDGWFLYHDADVDELTLKVHDDSADTNSESTAIATVIENVTDGTGQYGFSGAIRNSDGHLIIAVCTDFDTATGDFRVFDINGTGSIVEKTAIATDKDDCYYPSVFIDQKTNNIYIAYTGKSDGTETLLTTASIYYAKSTDDGISWSVDNLYSATGSDWGITWTPLSGPIFLVAWRDISANGVLTNFDNRVQVKFPTSFNNYLFPKSASAGVISITEKIR